VCLVIAIKLQELKSKKEKKILDRLKTKLMGTGFFNNQLYAQEFSLPLLKLLCTPILNLEIGLTYQRSHLIKYLLE
jgi:hypothetical protein